MRIHWFAFTVHAPASHGFDLWERFFFHSLGHMVETERKGRGFEKISTALNEAKLYTEPLKQKNSHGQDIDEYYHIELTGTACDACIPTIFQDVVMFLEASKLRWNMKRIDIAWDDLPFTPVQFCEEIVQGRVISCAKRETLHIGQSPFQKRLAGDGIGCDTCYFGSKDSQRFIRVYNQRGGTRLEIVYRDERAHVVALDIFQYEYQAWDNRAKMHLVQYIRFTEVFTAWVDFIGSTPSANIKISSARLVSLSRMESWFERQVSVALSVYYDVWGHQDARKRLDKMLSKASASRDRSRYRSVLQLSNAGGVL